MKRIMSASESLDFNIFIDKMGITNKDIYQTILDDFIESNLKIKTFMKYFNTSGYYAGIINEGRIIINENCSQRY